ncbi:glutaminyl-peptide cyclotransferase [Ferruginibacter profundus]
MKIFSSTILLFAFISCNSNYSNLNDKDQIDSEKVINSNNMILSFNVTNQFPHDTASFTEGLFWENRKLYESTGAPEDLPNTKSLFGIVNLSSGRIENFKEIDKNIYFGEGITILEGKLYQLTYKNKICFVYNAKNYRLLKTFSYNNNEGWGLTNDSLNLIMSDGTNKITFLNPKTFQIVKELYVLEKNSIVENINELEYVNGFIYANIYTTNIIIKIDAASGEVIKKIDLTFLYQQALKQNPNSLEMNGIAYNPETKRFYITGKMWPYIFEGTFY